MGRFQIFTRSRAKRLCRRSSVPSVTAVAVDQPSARVSEVRLQERLPDACCSSCRGLWWDRIRQDEFRTPLQAQRIGPKVVVLCRGSRSRFETPSTVEDARDVVRMYLHDAGRISLPMRCGEVEVAMRIPPTRRRAPYPVSGREGATRRHNPTDRSRTPLFSTPLDLDARLRRR